MSKGLSVAELLASLDHPARASALLLRTAIAAQNPALTEQVKWNAPSFCDAGDDRVTFRFMPKGGGLQVIFHRGARPTPVPGFRFADPTGLITWAAHDRGVITLADTAATERHAHAIAELVTAWVAATRVPH